MEKWRKSTTNLTKYPCQVMHQFKTKKAFKMQWLYESKSYVWITSSSGQMIHYHSTHATSFLGRINVGLAEADASVKLPPIWVSAERRKNTEVITVVNHIIITMTSITRWNIVHCFVFVARCNRWLSWTMEYERPNTLICAIAPILKPPAAKASRRDELSFYRTPQ